MASMKSFYRNVRYSVRYYLRSAREALFPANIDRFLWKFAKQPERTPVAIKPEMTEPEILLFKKYLSTVTKYVEFGAGGSSALALEYANIQTLHCVESDKHWIDHMLQNNQIRENVEKGRLALLHADIGRTEEWGMPYSTWKVHKWPFYSWGVWRYLPKDPDFILVDGRFRVACTLMCILMVSEWRSRLSPQFLENLPFIALHDYTFRPRYHIVEKYLQPVDSADSLVIFRFLSDISHSQLILDIYDHIFLPDDDLDNKMLINLKF